MISLKSKGINSINSKCPMNQFGVPLVGYYWFTKERFAQNIFNLVKQGLFLQEKV